MPQLLLPPHSLSIEPGQSGANAEVLHKKMSWEERNGKGRYYTRSRREGGRIVREYVDTGPVAEIIAKRDDEERRRREEEARAWREEREHLEVLDTQGGELDELAELLTRAAFLAAGYRQHDRGEWRKPRERDKPTG